MKHIKIKTRVLYLTLGIALSVLVAGCSGTSVYVLNQDEIIMLRKGEAMTAPYDGTYYSARAENRIMDAKIIKEKLK